MKTQVEKLCKELNIPLDGTEDSETPSRLDIKRARQTVESSLVCICGPISRPLAARDSDCECNSLRCLPFQCVQHKTVPVERNVEELPQVTDITSLDRVLEHKTIPLERKTEELLQLTDITSLERLTEYTEPTSSSVASVDIKSSEGFEPMVVKFETYTLGIVPPPMTPLLYETSSELIKYIEAEIAESAIDSEAFPGTPSPTPSVSY